MIKIRSTYIKPYIIEPPQQITISRISKIYINNGSIFDLECGEEA